MTKTTLKRFLDGKAPLMEEGPWGGPIMKENSIRWVWRDNTQNTIWATHTLDDGTVITYCLD